MRPLQAKSLADFTHDRHDKEKAKHIRNNHDKVGGYRCRGNEKQANNKQHDPHKPGRKLFVC